MIAVYSGEAQKKNRLDDRDQPSGIETNTLTYIHRKRRTDWMTETSPVE